MSKLTTQPAVNILSLMSDYDTDAECRAYLEELRWPNGVECPRCQSKKLSRIKARKVFDCDVCRYQFSATAGTIFHDSHLPLPKWFMAIFLISESKKGMSALQLKRLLKVSYKTAWYLSHRIREAMRTDDARPLNGTVEADETYIGGKRRGAGMGGWRLTKAAVLAVVERGGEIRIERCDAIAPNKKRMQKFVRKHAPNPKRIMTDEHLGYQGLGDHDTTHETVTHSKKEYVRGDVHTNTVESAFGLFKRSLVGSFHQVSVKHLDRYLDEFEFRYNNRKNAYLFRDTLIRLTKGAALPYDKLTKSA
jgi:transposase-like protein